MLTSIGSGKYTFLVTGGYVLFALTMFVAGLIAEDGRERPATEFRPHPAYALLEKLVRVPPQLTVLEVSSHNKRGVNGDDGWPLYKDARGDDVIFDAAGPGCIKSMWGTAFDPNAVLFLQAREISIVFSVYKYEFGIITMMNPRELFTIGYEGRNLDEFSTDPQ